MTKYLYLAIHLHYFLHLFVLDFTHLFRPLFFLSLPHIFLPPAELCSYKFITNPTS